MFLDVHGNHIHYQKSGNGQPIILLHGNGENLSIFKESVRLLQNFFTVYALDMAGSGKSYRPKKLHYDSHAGDVFAFIRQLKLQKPVLYGFSDGGIVGLLLASKYPQLLSKLIVSGVNIHPRGLNRFNRIKTQIRYRLTGSDGARMMLEEPNITRQELSRITVPTYLTVGEHDCIRPIHTRFIHKYIPDCHLHVFKGHMHGSYVVHSKIIARYILAVT